MKTRNLVLARVLKLQAQREKMTRKLKDPTLDPRLRNAILKQLKAVQGSLRG